MKFISVRRDVTKKMKFSQKIVETILASDKFFRGGTQE
jgi:hypothetical protein